MPYARRRKERVIYGDQEETSCGCGHPCGDRSDGICSGGEPGSSGNDSRRAFASSDANALVYG